MTEQQFEALVELIQALAREAVVDARPAHNRLAATDGGEGAIALAKIFLVEEQEKEET